MTNNKQNPNNEQNTNCAATPLYLISLSQHMFGWIKIEATYKSTGEHLSQYRTGHPSPYPNSVNKWQNRQDVLNLRYPEIRWGFILSMFSQLY